MGYIRHHAILVTAFSSEEAEKAQKQALLIFQGSFERLVSRLHESVINGDYSFAIFPDGSKEGWEDSEQGNAYRADFKAWLRSQMYEDGSGPYKWVEVQYGDDEWETAVTDDSDADRRQQPPDDAAGSER